MNSKIVIVGTGGVGSAAAYAMAIQRVCNELVLVDINADKAEGEARDISHALPFLAEMKVYSGGYEHCKDADIIVVTAGANRKPHESRLDLAVKNNQISKVIFDDIMKHYTDGVIIIATNPVDVITSLAVKWTGLPAGKVIGTGTTLDTLRFRHELSRVLKVDAEHVNAYILGEHGDSQFASWDLSNIAGIDIATYFKITGQKFDSNVKNTITENVKTGGSQVIQRKGLTNTGIAICITALSTSILGARNSVYTVGTMLDGLYDIKGVAISTLCVVGQGGVLKQLEYPLIPEELALLQHSAKQVKAVLDGV